MMEFDASASLLLPVDYIPSPNHNDRPDADDISLLVVHGISLPPGEYGGDAITDLFLNRLDEAAHPCFFELQGLEVSAHLLIRRDGQVIQYVPFNKRAWHAGVSEYGGRSGCNDFSIGIELEGQDDEPYELEQYQQLARVSAVLLKNFPKLSIDRIVGHSDVAPGRKTDPGPAFDWDLYRNLLTKEL